MLRSVCGWCYDNFLNECSYSEVKVRLWGKHASAFVVDQTLTQTDGRPFAVLFVGGLIKKVPRYVACVRFGSW